jgi:hypothetical protein
MKKAHINSLALIDMSVAPRPGTLACCRPGHVCPPIDER